MSDLSVTQMLQELTYVQNQITCSEYHQNIPMLRVIVLDVIAELKQTQFMFEIPRTSNYKFHMKTYADIARRYRNKAVSDLEELHNELSSKNVNEKRCLAIISNLKETTFYKAQVKAKVDGWKAIGGRKIINEQLSY